MLGACMIDGLGWFPEAVYRRTFLLFETVEYLFPPMRRGLMVPPHLLHRSDIKVLQPETPGDRLSRRADLAGRLAAEPGFLQLVATVPDQDIAAALRIVHADREVPAGHASGGAWALAWLVEKLLDHCESTDQVPVVGQASAARLIAHAAREREVSLPAGQLMTPRHASAMHAVAAGLSYGFLSDEQLLSADMAELETFKAKNQGLLRRHHQHLVAVVDRFAECLDDPRRFGERVVALRQDALRVRVELDSEAEDAMRTAGFGFIDKVAPVAAAALATALALAGTQSSLEIARAVAPTLGTGAAFAAAVSLASLRRGSAGRAPTSVSYLFAARSVLDELGEPALP